MSLRIFAVHALLVALLGIAACNDSSTDPIDNTPNTVTGAWLASSVAGESAGPFGMLLTQDGTSVTGSGSLLPGTFTAEFHDPDFTGSGTWGGDPYAFAYVLSTDGATLDGTFSINGDDHPFTFHKLSSSPVNPDPSTPVVVATSPADDETGVDQGISLISITWSKPVCGWDCALIGSIGGIQQTVYGNDLVDASLNEWNPATKTFSYHLKIQLDAESTYTFMLDTGSDVDWRDAFGVPAWASTASAYQFSFTTGGDEGPYTCADFQGDWETHAFAADGPGAPWWQWGRLAMADDCSFTGSSTDIHGGNESISGSSELSAGGIITFAGGGNGFRGAMDADADVLVGTTTWTGWQAGTSEFTVGVKQSGVYALSDLVGRWEDFRLASEPGAPWWMRGPLIVAADGSFSATLTDIDGDIDTITGTHPGISADGIIEGWGDIGARGAMNAGRTVIVGTATWDGGATGTAELSVDVKMAESYSVSDLEGTWEFHLVSAGSGAWWQRATVAIGPDGSFTAQTMENDGDTDSVAGTFGISADGLLSLADVSSFRGALDAGKTVLVWTSTHEGGAGEMGVGVKMR